MKLVGNGHVLNRDTFAVDVRYEVIDRSIVIGPGTESGTQLPPECEFVGLPGPLPRSVRFTLVMSDGRKLDFYSWGRDANGHDDIRPTGAIYK